MYMYIQGPFHTSFRPPLAPGRSARPPSWRGGTFPRASLRHPWPPPPRDPPGELQTIREPCFKQRNTCRERTRERERERQGGRRYYDIMLFCHQHTSKTTVVYVYACMYVCINLNRPLTIGLELCKHPAPSHGGSLHHRRHRRCSSLLEFIWEFPKTGDPNIVP